jgi:hypothetical protein
MFKKISILVVLTALTFVLTTDFASAQRWRRGDNNPRYAGPVDAYDSGRPNSVKPGESKMKVDGGDVTGNTGGSVSGDGNGRVIYRGSCCGPFVKYVRITSSDCDCEPGLYYYAGCFPRHWVKRVFCVTSPCTGEVEYYGGCLRPVVRLYPAEE